MAISHLLPLLLSVLVTTPTVQAQDCDCYLINGSSPTYFKSYGFWDFRSLSEHTDVPAKIDTPQAAKTADYSSSYFSGPSPFTDFWGPQNWGDPDEGDFPMVNSYSNLYIEDNEDGDSDTYMTMRTYRQSSSQVAAEFESLKLVDHASMRMYSRTTGSSGACTAMFTYKDAAALKDVQESDIEILTKEEATVIHYTNQPSYLEDGSTVDGASHTLTMPDGRGWDQWNVHRLDWTPGKTTWSVNGDELFAMSFQAPVDPTPIIFNAWSNGESGWTGKMDIDGAAYQQIQWIEMAYDVTDEASCSSVCSVDEGDVGSPTKL